MSDSPAVDRAIGAFDSGVGGLTVARVLLDQLPAEPLAPRRGDRERAVRSAAARRRLPPCACRRFLGPEIGPVATVQVASVQVAA